MTTTGKVAIVSPAIIGVYCTECCPVKYVSAIGRVLSSGFPIKMRENGNSFHASRKLKIVTVDKTGFEIGRNTLKKISNVFPPSMITASSISLGIVAANVVTRKIAFGNPNAV